MFEKNRMTIRPITNTENNLDHDLEEDEHSETIRITVSVVTCTYQMNIHAVYIFVSCVLLGLFENKFHLFFITFRIL